MSLTSPCTLLEVLVLKPGRVCSCLNIMQHFALPHSFQSLDEQQAICIRWYNDDEDYDVIVHVCGLTYRM